MSHIQKHPIETAPKDGSIFLAIGPSDTPPWEAYYACCWDASEASNQYGNWVMVKPQHVEVEGEIFLSPTHWVDILTPEGNLKDD